MYNEIVFGSCIKYVSIYYTYRLTHLETSHACIHVQSHGNDIIYSTRVLIVQSVEMTINNNKRSIQIIIMFDFLHFWSYCRHVYTDREY